MKTIKNIVLTLFLLTSSIVLSQDCSIIKNNHFTYKLNGKNVAVEFKEDKHIERHPGGYIIISRIEWKSDCEYTLVLRRATLPSFPLKRGDKVDVTISKIEENTVYYKTVVGEFTAQGKMTLDKSKKEEKN